MNRGEIWWAELPEPRGSEPARKRPVLILQADEFNRSRINTVVCAVLTSNLALADAPGNVMIEKECSNLPKDSVANVSQIITLDRKFLQGCAGVLDYKRLKKVEEGVRLVLSL